MLSDDCRYLAPAHLVTDGLHPQAASRGLDRVTTSKRRTKSLKTEYGSTSLVPELFTPRTNLANILLDKIVIEFS